MPNLVHFNNFTKFREAISFLDFSEDSDDAILKVETYRPDEESVTMKFTTDRGIVVNVDATMRSSLMDGTAYVRLHDFIVICKTSVRDMDCALWLDDGRLWIGTSFNETLKGFECESSLPLVDGFEPDTSFSKTSSIRLDQATLATIADACYQFSSVEIWRIGGLVSFRTGDDRVSIATVMNNAGGDPQQIDESLPDLAIRMTVPAFKVIGMVTDNMSVELQLDETNGFIRAEGDRYSVTCRYEPGQLKSESIDGMKPYMKFDAVAMAITIDMIYKINYLDPTEPVKMVPIDETTVSFEVSHGDRYQSTITVPGVHMYDTVSSVMLPMDVITMMVRNCKCPVLTLLTGDNGKLFLCYQNSNFGRKCMYFGD